MTGLPKPPGAVVAPLGLGVRTGCAGRGWSNRGSAGAGNRVAADPSVAVVAAAPLDRGYLAFVDSGRHRARGRVARRAARTPLCHTRRARSRVVRGDGRTGRVAYPLDPGMVLD